MMMRVCNPRTQDLKKACYECETSRNYIQSMKKVNQGYIAGHYLEIFSFEEYLLW